MQMNGEKIYRVIGKEGIVTIPCTLRACIGIAPNDVVSFEQVSEDAVLVRREQLVNRAEEPVELPSLELLLKNLPESKKCAARYYLSILCSERDLG